MFNQMIEGFVVGGAIAALVVMGMGAVATVAPVAVGAALGAIWNMTKSPTARRVRY